MLTVKYEELVADPSALLNRTYASLDLGNYGAVAPVIGDYLAKQRDYRPNHHELDEATRELLRERWRGDYDLHEY